MSQHLCGDRNRWASTLLASFLLVASTLAVAPRATCGQRPDGLNRRSNSSPSSRNGRRRGPRITYGGAVYYSFPNYDIVLSGLPGDAPAGGGFLQGAPANLDQLILGAGQQSGVIVKNSRGMRWNGADLLMHPAHSYQRVTQYYAWNRDIGEFRPSADANELSPKPRPTPTTAPRTANRNTALATTDLGFIAQPWVVVDPTPAASGGYFNDEPPRVAVSTANDRPRRVRMGTSRVSATDPENDNGLPALPGLLESVSQRNRAGKNGE